MKFLKMECLLASKELSVSKNKNFKKIQTVLVDNFKNLQLAPHIVEELVQSHYKENKKIVSLEGVLLRLAMDNKISREEFLKYYIGNEINPKFESFLKENPLAEKYIKKYMGSFEMINNIKRWCLWLENMNQNDLKKMPGVKNKIEEVKKFRLQSDRKSTNKSAETKPSFILSLVFSSNTGYGDSSISFWCFR